MTDGDVRQLSRLLEEIRDTQRLQLERQTEALAVQREHLAMVQRQTERAERLQDRAEQLQTRSAQLMGSARTISTVLIPVVVALMVYVSWLIFRR
jgi:hypothetical protein